MHYYLGLHPEISMTREKELNFFTSPKNIQRGLDWYHKQFRGTANVYGESSPSYTNHPWAAGVPQRMHAVVPEAKLIFLVGDPGLRARLGRRVRN